MKGVEFATLQSLSPRLSAQWPRVRKHLPRKTLFLKCYFLSPDPKRMISRGMPLWTVLGQLFPSEVSDCSCSSNRRIISFLCVNETASTEIYWDIFLSELNPSYVAKLPAMELAVNEANCYVATIATHHIFKEGKYSYWNSNASQFGANWTMFGSLQQPSAHG